MMRLIFSDRFMKEYGKIRNQGLKERIMKQLTKLEADPETGKPLKYEYRNERSIRVTPDRIIYEIRGDEILLLKFDHRKHAYD